MSGGKIMKDIEVQEALTFQTAAVAAFTDLRDILELRDEATTAHAGCGRVAHATFIVVDGYLAGVAISVRRTATRGASPVRNRAR